MPGPAHDTFNEGSVAGGDESLMNLNGAQDYF